MDRRCRWTERRNQDGEVIGIAGEDVVSQSQRKDHEVSVDNVCGLGLGQKPSNGAAIIEGVNSDRVEERSEACPAGTGPPHLSNDRVRRVERRLGPAGGGEKGSSSSFTSVDGDQKACVENHRA